MAQLGARSRPPLPDRAALRCSWLTPVQPTAAALVGLPAPIHEGWRLWLLPDRRGDGATPRQPKKRAKTARKRGPPQGGIPMPPPPWITTGKKLVDRLSTKAKVEAGKSVTSSA